MSGVIASAPGKIVLSGEYAVLDGAPAICMAVDRRARVNARCLEAEWNSISTRGYLAAEGRFIASGGTVEWLEGKGKFDLIDAVWRTLSPLGNKSLSIELDTGAFFDATSGQKLGLGSSAALTVALVAALTESNNVFDKALRIHRLFQGGVGSGVDIASGVHGGLIEYRMENRAIRPLCWPVGLKYRLIWMGVAASTGAKLKRLEGARNHRSRDMLAASAASVAAAWHSAAEVLARYPAYIAVLRQFSDDYDLGIFEAGHDKLASDAVAAGLVYKPCGAGGGDVGILLGTSDEQLDEFVTGIDVHVGWPLDCELELPGVEWERL